MGVESFAEKVEAEWLRIKNGPATLTNEEITKVKSYFTEPAYEIFNDVDASAELEAQANANKAFDNWLKRNVLQHKKDGYAVVNLSLKPTGIAPGDVTDKQLEIIADLADDYSFSEIRNTHEQNIVLADVAKKDLFTLWEKAKSAGLATPNIGFLTDIICCPGGDFCALANAKSIPVAEAIQRKFDDLDYVYELGKIDLNISGCMNACGHHHVGHIGILGVDKKGKEFYQICLGGSASKDASVAKILGPSFDTDDVPDVLEKILDVYVTKRSHIDEQFIDTYRRIGMDPFKEAVYA
jgi:sulfite reductase (NADPH) hemoprotein beta-component